jgi:electron transfer flavoprotein beta subunit
MHTQIGGSKCGQMNILVCIKQVPESEATYTIDASSQWVRTGSGTEFMMNRYDECAMEEAARIKEAFTGTAIDVLSIGPPDVETVIRRAIGMGADNGIHMVTGLEEFYDSFTLASWIADVAGPGAYDLIFTGVMSEDMMQGLVGPLTAELLCMPCATAVVSEALSVHKGTILVEREVEGGCRETVELKLPALLTIQTGINKPRYPSLSNLLRANQLPIRTIQTDLLDKPVKQQLVDRVRFPQNIRNGIFLTGSAEEKAGQLVKILDERSLLMNS